jgi:hypothetical protein
MVIGNGNFDRLVGLWSFHTIFSFNRAVGSAAKSLYKMKQKM